MHLILHIGTEKTGSTTIQSFLSLNSKLIKDSGGFYLRDRRGIESLSSAPLSSQAHSHIYKAFSNAIRNLNSKFFIISAELLQSRLLRKADILMFRARLDELGIFSSYKVIVYLRRPAEIANSMISTAVQYDRLSTQGLYTKYLSHVCNHKQTLEGWGDAFGRSSLCPRIFSKSRLLHSDLVLDFIDAAFPFKQNHQFTTGVAAKNANISTNGILLMQEVNREINAKYPHLNRVERFKLRNRIYKSIEACMDSPKHIMHPHHWKYYNEEFLQSDSWVCKNFFPDQATLWDYNIPEYIKPTLIAQSNIRSIAKILVSQL